MKYPLAKYPPPAKYKLGDIDTASNIVIHKASFPDVSPLLLDLVEQIEVLHPQLDIQSVWIIKKSEEGDGFQSWHQDLINNGQTAITLVVNIGTLFDDDTDESSFFN